MEKRALLIGCNYFNSSSARLYGCIEDIVNIHKLLTTQYGYLPENIVSLRDDDTTNMPTLANIIIALNKIIAQSSSSSEIWIHYSGHGTQLTDINGDESDAKDEAIIPVDYLSSGFITDDRLFDIIKNTKCRTMMCFDSCHSGSVCDLQYSINYVNGSFVKSQTTNKSIQNPHVIMLSGCRDEQTSADAYITSSKKYEGAFTNALVNALTKLKFVCDIMPVYNEVCSSLLINKYKQIPVLSSSSSNPSFAFGAPILAPIVVPPVPAPIIVIQQTTPVVIPPPAPLPIPVPVQIPIKPPAPVSPPAPVRPPAQVRPQNVVKPPTKPTAKPNYMSFLSMIYSNGPRPVYTTTKPKPKRELNTGIVSHKMKLIFN